MALDVQKYGGRSICDAAHMRAVAGRIAEDVNGGAQLVVAVSAIGNETDELLELPQEVSSVQNGRELDMLITAGERKAAALLCLALQDRGVAADSFTGAQAGIVTDANHTEARIVEVHPDRLRATLDSGRVPVVGGAPGFSTTGEITFLGRGGTDTTAVALAGALGAGCCEIYTDVRGIFTADPRVATEARLLEHVAFDEMLAMCAAGCPKPATQAVELARETGVPLHVRSALTREPGTRIGVTGVGHDATVIAVVNHSDAGRVSIIGPGAEASSDAVARMLDVLRAEGIETCRPENAPMRLTCQLRRDELETAVIALHREFGLGTRPRDVT